MKARRRLEAGEEQYREGWTRRRQMKVRNKTEKERERGKSEGGKEGERDRETGREVQFIHSLIKVDIALKRCVLINRGKERH